MSEYLNIDLIWDEEPFKIKVRNEEDIPCQQEAPR